LKRLLKRLLKITFGLTVIIAGLVLIHIKPKTVIFGDFAGECIGNCGTMYEVSTNIIRKDTTSFWQTYSNLNKLQIKGQKFAEKGETGDYNEFKLAIPIFMLLDPRERFGCPGCIDQVAYYLQFTLFGITRRFQIDPGHEPFYFPGLTRDIDDKIRHVAWRLD
jgi:hypothetical protein